MQSPENRFIGILKKIGVDFLLALPCDRVKSLLERLSSKGAYIPLTREEEGVGISAGASLAGRRPAMIIQSSGLGNMVNALLSLTMFYNLPLAIFVSHRGIYRESIEAQKPMGKALKGLLKAAGVGYTLINRKDDLYKIERPLRRIYEEGRVHAFLLSPAVWEGCAGMSGQERERIFAPQRLSYKQKKRKALFTRYQVLEVIKDYLKGNIVVSNLGIPSKELYHILHQPTNFYMLGSMGMATPVGLGVALNTKKKVYVIDGDGSLLMNPGALATVAVFNPSNLTILAIDNAAYGSTGNQPTHTAVSTDLSLVARGFGIRNIYTVSSKNDILRAMETEQRGTKFIHIITKPGNAIVPNIPLTANQIKDAFTEAIKT
ncbi:MAG: sulfopyruvate decarboxylase subunit beta [Nitrospirae bacterium]|nr:sulfopyruvate decarboxylase subunit beta [Nitrospirota bacterium]